jgi:uncharacterized protein involved in cysteine biosynthesis
VFSALWKTLTLFQEKRFWRVIKWSLLTTTATFVGLAIVVWVVLAKTDFFTTRWLDTVVDVLGGLTVVVLTWLLFPAVATLVIGLFLETIVVAVENRYYPFLPAPTSLSLGQSLLVALQFTVVAVVLNLLALPLYLIPGLNLLIFYGVNGYLLSREYYELVALRRVHPATAKSMRKTHRLQLFTAGVLITVLFTIPLVNLIAPLIVTAFMVHMVEGLRQAYQQ